MDAFSATHWSSACSATATRSRACCCAAATRPTCGSCRPRAAARRMQYFTGSKAHNIALRDRALAARLEAERIRAVPRRRRRACRRARPRRASTRRSAWRGSRRSCASTAARSRRPPSGALPRARSRARDLRGDLHMHTTATDGTRRPRDDGRGARTGRPSSTSRSPTTARRWRWPTGSTNTARSSMRHGSAR